MQIGPKADSRSKKRQKITTRNFVPMSEINVTPFVDIMLVLLIIFMVAAPLLSVGIEVDLPNTKAKPLAIEKERPLEDQRLELFLMLHLKRHLFGRKQSCMLGMKIKLTFS